ncbi:MAG: carbohydrate ABC transporter permease [Christensenellales bacterium]|jgi:multiple sugar transport system permease protein
MKSSRNKVSIVNIILLILLLLIVTFPFYVMLVGAFKLPIELAKMPVNLAPFTNFTLKNMNKVFNDSEVFLWIRNSFIISITVATSTIFTGISAGYAFAKIPFRGKAFFFALVMATMIMPKQMLMIPNYLVARALHLENSMVGVILTSIAPAFGVFLSRQQISSMPKELFDAAEIDGCGEVMQFIQIVLPLSLPTAGTIGILSFFATFNDFIWQSIMIIDKNLRTLPVGLSYFAALQVGNKGAQLAIALIATIPLGVLFIICQKFFIKGATVGAIKG